MVEVALALGIMAFAFVAIFSLLPAGMGVFRDSMNSSVSAQILQKVLADARLTDFSQLVYPDGSQPATPQGIMFRAPSANAPELRYFDDQGDEIVPSSPAARQNPDALTAAEKNKVIYHVNTRILTNAVLPAGTSSTAAQYLATVTVQIAVNPANRVLTFGSDKLFAAAPGIAVETFSAQLAKND